MHQIHLEANIIDSCFSSLKNEVIFLGENLNEYKPILLRFNCENETLYKENKFDHFPEEY